MFFIFIDIYECRWWKEYYSLWRLSMAVWTCFVNSPVVRGVGNSDCTQDIIWRLTFMSCGIAMVWERFMDRVIILILSYVTEGPWNYVCMVVLDLCTRRDIMGVRSTQIRPWSTTSRIVRSACILRVSVSSLVCWWHVLLIMSGARTCSPGCGLTWRVSILCPQDLDESLGRVPGVFCYI